MKLKSLLESFKLLVVVTSFFTLEIFCTQISIAKLPLEDNLTSDCTLSNQSKIISVPNEAKNIQEAINNIPKEGIVLIRGRINRENINIPEEKKIILQGLGAKRTKIFPSSDIKPTISISQGAEACINGLTIRGGRTGIKAGEFLLNDHDEVTLGKPALSVTLKYSNIESNENGLVLNAEKIKINKGKITKNSNSGAYLFSPSIEIIGLDVFSNLGLGLAILSGIECLPLGFYTANIENVEIWGNDGPGLTFCGPSDVTVRESNFADNLEADIKILGQSSGSTLLTLNNIQFAEADDGLWGDGLIAIDSPNIEVIGNVIGYNDRAGIYFNNSGGEIAANLIFNNVFSIALEEGADPAISESNIIFGNEVNMVSVGLGLEPAPPVEVPDLDD